MISTRIRRIFQGIVYLPHFLSWVLVIALFQQSLCGAGALNNLLRDLGASPIPFMTDPSTLRLMATFTYYAGVIGATGRPAPPPAWPRVWWVRC